jgi:hypothetical protein
MEIAKHKVEQAVVPLFKADEGDDMAQGHAHLLGHLIGLDYAESRHVKSIQGRWQADPQPRLPCGGTDVSQNRHAKRHAHRAAARRPHWADDGSLDFLSYLAQVNRDVPMLMIGLARPALFERRADWPGLADARRNRSGPLDRTLEPACLPTNSSGSCPTPPPCCAKLNHRRFRKAIPSTMEELLKMLVDERAIETGEGPQDSAPRETARRA